MQSSKEMRLVFFLDAIEHVARIARMIRQDRGNALLVGVGGTGKQSLTRYIIDVQFFSLFDTHLFHLIFFSGNVFPSLNFFYPET